MNHSRNTWKIGDVFVTFVEESFVKKTKVLFNFGQLNWVGDFAKAATIIDFESTYDDIWLARAHDRYWLLGIPPPQQKASINPWTIKYIRVLWLVSTWECCHDITKWGGVLIIRTVPWFVLYSALVVSVFGDRYIWHELVARSWRDC